jgi:TolB-like protein
MGNFFAELKRRHIYRVAAAYAVLAWLLLQLVNNIAPVLDLPPWVARAFLLALAIGFPVTLFFAWMRELGPADGATPRAATTRLDYVLAGALVVVIALVSYQQLVTTASTADQQASVTSALPQAEPRGIAIAVLPFANMSGDANQEFFSDGITEEINAALTKVPDLRVVARTSAFEFKGQNRNIRTVGESLGATHLIEGSVRKSGNRVRIAAQLVQADNGLNVWSESYDRELTDIFSIQEDIAKAIAISLRVPLGLPQGGNLIRSRTTDANTYEDYLRAKALVRARTGPAAMQQLLGAIELLQQVVNRDTNYAPAWALLGTAHALIPQFDPSFQSGAVDEARPLVEANLPRAEEAAKRAIQLDPQDADGHVASGLVHASRGRWATASKFYSKALELDRDNPDALHFYSGMFADLGYVKQAVELRQRLKVVEPFVPIFNAVTSRVFWVAGQLTASEIEKLPDDSLTSLNIRARTYAAQTQYGQAADALLESRVVQRQSAELASQILRSAPATPRQFPKLGGLDFVYLYTGAPERALVFYEDETRIHFFSGAWFMHVWAKPYDRLRKTERFKTLMRNAGLVDYWRARGWPDLCHPLGADDFVCD